MIGLINDPDHHFSLLTRILVDAELLIVDLKNLEVQIPSLFCFFVLGKCINLIPKIKAPIEYKVPLTYAHEKDKVITVVQV